MLENMPYIWLVVIVAAILLEAVTYDLVTIWFIPAGVIAFVLSLLPMDIPVYVQVLLFFVLGFVFVVISKTLLKNSLKKNPIVHTNFDSLPGKEAIVVEKVNNLMGVGAVKVDGKVWSAITEQNDESLEKGEVVIVKEIRGVKLVCVKK